MIQRPTAEITGVKLQNATLTEATLLFDVKVDNPYAVALPTSNVDYALSSQGQQFVSGKAASMGTIPAGQCKIFAVSVQINYVQLINCVKTARPGCTIPYKADLGLSVELPALGSQRLPMCKEGQLTIPTATNVLDKVQGLIK